MWFWDLTGNILGGIFTVVLVIIVVVVIIYIIYVVGSGVEDLKHDAQYAQRRQQLERQRYLGGLPVDERIGYMSDEELYAFLLTPEGMNYANSSISMDREKGLILRIINHLPIESVIELLRGLPEDEQNELLAKLPDEKLHEIISS